MRVRGERQGGSVGFGWRLVAFDPAMRSGEVAQGGRTLRFDRAAAEDEDLRVGDEVFVRLVSSAPSEPHVARVWPCLTRLSTPEGAVLSPAPRLEARIAADAERMLAPLPRVDAVLAVVGAEGSLRLTLFDLDRNAYGLAGHDLTVHGALCCTGVRRGPARTLGHPALIRLADDAERAWALRDDASARGRLASETLVLALVDLRDELSPERGEAAVELIICDQLSWQPGPSGAGARVAEQLVAALEPWCDAVRWLLSDGEHGGAVADALLALAQEIVRAAGPFAGLPLPAARAPEPPVLAPLLLAFGGLLDALAAWLESLEHAGIATAPETPVIPALAALAGRIAEHHGDLVRRGALQSPAWHATIDLYTEYAYCGSTHGGGALLSRLHDRRPLRPGDTETLRALAARARAVALGLAPAVPR